MGAGAKLAQSGDILQHHHQRQDEAGDGHRVREYPRAERPRRRLLEGINEYHQHARRNRQRNGGTLAPAFLAGVRLTGGAFQPPQPSPHGEHHRYHREDDDDDHDRPRE